MFRKLNSESGVIALAILIALALVTSTCDASTDDDMTPVVVAADGHVVQAGERQRPATNWHKVYGTDEGLECAECGGGDK